ncbi:Peroxisomal membrane protein LPX1 [Sphaceloma murrayae]|uniref:Peroxisomal membrane protein LPX1 n=1 Tax=Sphaceloma murrayae TaxID=2082308 RepID=A0A2K1QY12_9PEZI|nr:Peroxisomal membrane protein LPX1 [Sphaceloma murrayae]
MSTTHFTIKTHTVPCSHIRQYPRATLSGREEPLSLAVKQYIPLSDPTPQDGAITILAAHANGFPKELYEPLWDALYVRLRSQGQSIRAIWIADVAWQGYSSELNEGKLGNDPYWTDHARDLFLLVNRFGDEFVRPVVGIGHSMGGHNLVNLALMHPRLFHSLVLLDPVIARVPGAGNWLPARASAVRRDIWPSRQAAREAFSRSKFYQSWHPGVLERWVEHGLRDLPTGLYPDVEAVEVRGRIAGQTPVTLRTSKHNEVFSFLRPNFVRDGVQDPGRRPDRRTHPDVDTALEPPASPFYRAEPGETFHRLQFVRPSVLYVFGEKSEVSTKLLRADKMAVTGTGVGGNGGAKTGGTKEVAVDAGHLVAMEKVDECADHAADWIGKEVGRWKREEEQWQKEISETKPEERYTISEEFKGVISGDWLNKALAGEKAKL